MANNTKKGYTWTNTGLKPRISVADPNGHQPFVKRNTTVPPGVQSELKMLKEKRKKKN